MAHFLEMEDKYHTKTICLYDNFIPFVMNKIETRICIRTKDICNITGYSERQARNIINDIKVYFKKQKHQPVTVTELSQFMNIPLEQIKPYLI